MPSMKPGQTSPGHPEWHYRQSAAIPFRTTAEGVEVLLITSKKRKHWIVPKGVVELSMTPAASAAAEALEEAGVRGTVSDQSLGTYQYSKWGGTCTVEVFAMAVTTELDDWPEKSLRSRKWVPLEEAAEMVEVAPLAGLILALKGFLGEQNNERHGQRENGS